MRKTIIFVGPGRLPIPCDRGAIEEVIWKTSLELVKHGYSVKLFNPLSRNLVTRNAKTLGLHGVLKDTDKNIILHFHDIVLCTSYSSTFTKYHVEDTILSLHYPPWVTRSRKRFILMVSLLKYLASRGVVFTAPSKAITLWLRKMIKAKAYTVPNGVDVELFHPSKRSIELREKLLDGKDVLITYVARIHPDKNQLDLVKAISLLVREHGVRNFKVVFVGPLSGSFSHNGGSSVNPYWLLLRSYIEKNSLKGYVGFLGELPNKEEVSRMLASSDIYIHTSLVEASLPLALMEAMASRLPVITYRLVYYDFIVDGLNAITVEKGDIYTLSRRLVELIEDEKLRRRLSENARMFAERYLSWSSIVKNYYLRLYSDFGDKREFSG
jgi:glycosyltransferase involved in cell wall biosynthesis